MLNNFQVGFFIIAMITLIFIGGSLFLIRKRNLTGKNQKNLTDDLINRVKNSPDKISEKLLMRMKDKGVDFVPQIAEIWPELSPEKRDQLWEFWESEGYIDVFIKGLGAKNEERRMEAAQVLTLINNKKLLIPLMDALTLPDQYVPARVAEVLLSFGPDAVELMTGRLTDLPDEAKCLVISILEELEDPQAIPFLIKELSHPSPQVRMKTVEALGQIGNGEIVDSIIPMMEDNDWGVRSRAAKALGKMNNGKAIPALEQALQDEAWWVRANAQEALKRIALTKEGNSR
ncbi:MAG: HEAT repeat domain-containing protein [Dehalobacterium sp.]